MSAGLSPPQPPIKAALGRVSQHRDRQLRSIVAAEKAAKLVHQVSEHTWHTTWVYRRCAQATHTQTHGRPTPSTQTGQTHTSAELQLAGASPSITHTQEHTPPPQIISLQTLLLHKQAFPRPLQHRQQAESECTCRSLTAVQSSVSLKLSSLEDIHHQTGRRNRVWGWGSSSQCQVGLLILSFHSTIGDSLTS